MSPQYILKKKLTFIILFLDKVLENITHLLTVDFKARSTVVFWVGTLLNYNHFAMIGRRFVVII